MPSNGVNPIMSVLEIRDLKVSVKLPEGGSSRSWPGST